MKTAVKEPKTEEKKAPVAPVISDAVKNASKKFDDAVETAYSVADEPEKKETKPDKNEKPVADANAGDDDDKGKKGKFEEDLLARAEAAGITREDAEEFSSAKDLEKALKFAEQTEEVPTLEEITAAVKAQIAQESKAPAGEKKDDDKPYDVGANLVELGEDIAEYDPNLVKAINKMANDLIAKIKPATGKDDSNLAEKIESERLTDWFDRQIAKLGDDFKDVYGEGDVDDLDPTSAEFRNRAALDERRRQIIASYQKSKKPVPSRNAVFKMAVEELNKGKKPKADKEKMKNLADNALGRGSQRSSGTTSEEIVSKANKDFDAKLED